MAELDGHQDDQPHEPAMQKDFSEAYPPTFTAVLSVLNQQTPSENLDPVQAQILRMSKSSLSGQREVGCQVEFILENENKLI